MMRRAAAVAGTCVAALLVLAVTTVGALIGLNAECNGAASECPRSDTYRWTRVALPPAVLLILAAGAIVAVRRRSVRPLLLACGAAIVFVVATGAALG